MSTLADDFLAAAADRDMPEIVRRDFAYVARKIASAQRFVVSEDVRGAIRSLLTSRPSSLLAAARFARLPFDRCWFEWKPPGYANLKPGQIVVERCGAILERYGENGFTVFTAWKFDKRAYWEALKNDGDGVVDIFDKLPRLNLSSIVGAYDFSSFEGLPGIINDGRHMWLPNPTLPADMEDEYLQAIRDDEKNGVRFALKDRAEREALTRLDSRAAFRCHTEVRGELRLAEQIERGQGRSAIADVQDEMGHLFAILVLMNARNCVSIAPFEPAEKLNKARSKAGKPALMPYSTVHIELTQAQKRAVAAGTITREEARRHLVRGHFKTRKSGVFWWSEHARGDALRGFVDRRETIVEAGAAP